MVSNLREVLVPSITRQCDLTDRCLVYRPRGWPVAKRAANNAVDAGSSSEDLTTWIIADPSRLSLPDYRGVLKVAPNVVEVDERVLDHPSKGLRRWYEP
jgi:hypothetical protein